MQRKIVPNVVTRKQVATVVVEDTAFQAAKLMADKHIAALVVVDGEGKIIGIVTERDMTQRIIAAGLDGKTTPVKNIMTENPDTLSPDDSAGDALELMQTRNYRHLPVTEDGKCIAVVSIRDLYASVKEALEEDIRETEAFVFGDRYGA
ncbi:MAG: CBS domain-containing protein [Rhodospirillales bacterium]|nr:CBS domain-containing protein [Rhodospirillales bacterium]